MGTLLSLCLGNDESHVGHAQMKRQRQKQIQQQRKQQQKEHKTFKRDQRSKSMAGGLRPTLSVPSNGGQQSQPRRASLNRLTESPPESPNRKLSLPANSPVGNSPTSPDSRSFNYERDSRKSLKREGSGGGGEEILTPREDEWRRYRRGKETYHAEVHVNSQIKKSRRNSDIIERRVTYLRTTWPAYKPSLHLCIVFTSVLWFTLMWYCCGLECEGFTYSIEKMLLLPWKKKTVIWKTMRENICYCEKSVDCKSGYISEQDFSFRKFFCLRHLLSVREFKVSTY